MRSTLTLLFLILTIPAMAAPPRTLSYQGVLTDDTGASVVDGSYSMTFRIYAAPSSGQALWSETQDVVVTAGNFDVVLGSATLMSSLSFETPYWLGLAVGGDPEMTPRTELTSTAYSHIARTVENGAITQAKLANNTVVRGLNGKRDNVTLVGGDGVSISTSGNSIEISASGGGTASGVASAKGVTSGALNSSLTNLVSRSIDCPSDGYVLVIASAEVYLSHTSGNPTYVQVGTSDEPGALPSNQDIVAQIPFSAASGLYTIPLTSHGLYPVSAGANTFYMLGQIGSTSGSASVSNRQLSLVFFEASYGSVSPTVVADPEERLEMAPGR